MPRHLIASELATPPDYAHAAIVEAGEKLVFTAGGVPLDAEGALVGAGDLTTQTEQVLANLATALRLAGSDLRHVVRTEVYVVADAPADLSRVWEVVRRSDLSAPPHASTLLGVPCLGYEGQLVEITAVATVPD